jgi:hypothetical protein
VRGGYRIAYKRLEHSVVTIHVLIVALTNLFKTEPDFVGRFGADGASDFEAIFEEDGGGPEFYSKRSAERAAWAVFDFYVLGGGELGESFSDNGGSGLAVAAPGRAEFEEDGTVGGVDFFAGWARILIVGWHIAIFQKTPARSPRKPGFGPEKYFYN